MKFLVRAEEAVRGSRNALLAKLQEHYWFRYLSLLSVGRDIVLVTRQFGDHKLTFSPHEMIGKSLYRNGYYQRHLADRVLSLLGKPQGKTLLEIGANIGTHSVYLTRGDHFERLICIEPEPRNLDLLRHNLAQNHISEITTVFGYAVGDHDGFVDLYTSESNHGAGTIIKPASCSGSAIRVPLRRVDTILNEAAVDASDVGLVWMDIEGAEPEALKSMASLVERRTPILMEYAPSRFGRAKMEEMAAYLSQNYGRCIVFRDGRENEVDIRGVREGLNDILLLP